MSAYLIGRVTVRDPSYIAEYQSKTEPLIQRHNGQILVGAVGGTDSMAILEGGGTVPTAIFVIEFPSMKQAQAFYKDPDYAPMIALRQSCADSDIVLVQGL